MKTVNLYQIIDAWKSLGNNVFGKYIDYTGIGDAQDGVRKAEIEDFGCFVGYMQQHKIKMNECDSFFVNYSIPQIGKEFDLLRFGKNYILNVELKRQSTKEKIEHQLKRNAYYLKFQETPLILFTFITNTKELFVLHNGSIEEVTFHELVDCIRKQDVINNIDIDSVFNPANYLVSPFNSTRKFMEEEYFLTKQQEEIKSQVISAIEKYQNTCISITGKAGTGKTLLTYDIAKSAIKDGRKVLILHCAQLNHGQQVLIDNYKWEIFQTKDGVLKNFNNYDVVIIDEAQRARPNQYNTIVSKITVSHAVCIFSHDNNQCLNNYEMQQNISGQIQSLCQKTYTLTKKIRTNKEIADFITLLFDSKSTYNTKDFSNVSISYCSDFAKAKSILKHYSDIGWKTPRYTPGTMSVFHYEEYGVSGEDSAHSVIGQEYDRVVGVIDNHFFYDESGKLQSRNDKYYSQRQMLFQILTRTRKNLHILFIDNPVVFEKCIDILSL